LPVLLGLAALVVLALSLFLTACADLNQDDGSDSTTRRTTRTSATDEQPSQQQEDSGDNGSADNRSNTTLEIDSDSLLSPAEQVAERVSPSVVNVRVEGVVSDFFGESRRAQLGEGSGVIFTTDGYIITNNHVVTDQSGQPADAVVVTFTTGEELPAEIVGRDPTMDLAVIKVDSEDLPAATFLEDLAEVRVGQYAIAIGSPLSFQNSVTLGVVSGVQREIPFAGQLQQSLVDLIQTDAAISPGNSGGALVDARGRVIGINVAYLPPASTGAQNLGFAIPGDVAVDTAEQIIETGRAVHPYLGISSVSVAEVREQFGLSREEGVLVAELVQNTPAAEAGLEQGDIIFEINGEEVQDTADLFRILRRSEVGEQVEVRVDRDGEELTFQVTLGERPSDLG
jgi:S1-C subfamily serine protease